MSLIVLTVGVVSAQGFKYAAIIVVEGEDYYMKGAPDIPGHFLVQAGPNTVVGKHYNSGPVSNFWGSDADEGALLFMVDGIIDTWSLPKATYYVSCGYVHYHELVTVADGEEHPTKVVWPKQTAVSSFNYDGGSMPIFGHEVTPGIDYEFMPTGFMEYNP